MPQRTQEVLDIRPRQPVHRLEAQRRVLGDARRAERLACGGGLGLGDLLGRALEFGHCER